MVLVKAQSYNPAFFLWRALCSIFGHTKIAERVSLFWTGMGSGLEMIQRRQFRSVYLDGYMRMQCSAAKLTFDLFTWLNVWLAHSNIPAEYCIFAFVIIEHLPAALWQTREWFSLVNQRNHNRYSDLFVWSYFKNFPNISLHCHSFIFLYTTHRRHQNDLNIPDHSFGTYQIVKNYFEWSWFLKPSLRRKLIPSK